MTPNSISSDSFADVQALLKTHPQATIQRARDDTEDVSACLAAAIKYFNTNLSENIKTHITEKWGIARSTMAQINIGFTDPPEHSARPIRSSLVAVKGKLTRFNLPA